MRALPVGLPLGASLVALAGCAHSAPPAAPRAEPSAVEASPEASSPGPARELAEAQTPGLRPGPAAEHRGPLAWIADDYEGALEEARRRNVPLFVDLWAPWCHTCLSMKQTVFVDPGLAPLAERFVWLEVDADRPENAAALTALPPTAMPTFYVVSPADRSIQARLTGSAAVGQIRARLSQGQRGHRATLGDALPSTDPAWHLREADRAVAECLGAT